MPELASSFSAFLHKKGWRRVVSLSNDHYLPLLQRLGQPFSHYATEPLLRAYGRKMTVMG